MSMWRHTVCALVVLGLAACAAPTRTPSTSNQWQGRLSVTVRSEPPSVMSASFALQGDAHQGELDLFSPLGTTVASLNWTAQTARLTQGSHADVFGSIGELTEKTTGAALPVDALFDWLQGRPTAVSGWTSDLSQLAQGKLSAHRQWPQPEVSLRLQLDTAP